ncbi:MAG TPA: hypothetical protein VIL45_03590, partial [Thermoplasmata archaeon]
NVTLVAIHALNNGSTVDHQTLARIIRKRRKVDADVQRALDMFRTSGAIEKARADAEVFGSIAKKSLDSIADSDAKRSMIRLVDYVLTREA